MINASELRRGNLFADLTGKVHSVKGIHEDCIVIEYFRAVSSDFTLGGEGDFNRVWPTKSISFENALPIPLTPEILDKCGFVEGIGPMEGFLTYTNGASIFHQNDNLTYCDQRRPLTVVKYLHQLQNLFYCLIGQEIDIKL
jgi:hypothetical protein